MTRTSIWVSLAGALVLFGCTHGTVQEQVDSSLPLRESKPIDLNSALAQAKAEHRIVLLDFTGSDWCTPCMELRKQIFLDPAFQFYAESNLVVLVVDFPAKVQLPPAASATNDLLARQFQIEGFPTLVALNGEGKQIWKTLGLIEGGPKALKHQLEAARKE